MASTNFRKEGTGENWEQQTRSVNEPNREQQPLEIQPGSNREESSDQDTGNQAELVSNSHYVSADPTLIDDMEILTNNQLPSPITPEPESNYQKPHKGLLLKVSQGSHVPVPIDGEHRLVMRTKTVCTRGGRVIRNIYMNNSIKNNTASVAVKYPSAFSSYKNTFKPGSIKQSKQHKPSLRRDGQKRRLSSNERASDDAFGDGKKTTKISNQTSIDSCKSDASNSQLIANPYNVVNHKISSIVWCPCFFFFCFGCCLPGFYFMNRSDILFDEGDYNKALTLARVSTVFYILGMFLSVAFWVGIFAIILIFAT